MDDPSSSNRPQPDQNERLPRSEKIAEDTCSLINKAQMGDSQALDLLCSRYLPRLFHWATGRLPHHARRTIDTSDLVQETLINTVRRLGGFKPQHPGAFPAYLRRAILNRIRDEVRKSAAKPNISPPLGTEKDSSASPLEETIGHESVERYEQALMRLREEDRAVLFLKVELDMGYEEIAVALDKPSFDAARMAVRRALYRLAKEMSDAG